jgi:lactoylglutathione lyase
MGTPPSSRLGAVGIGVSDLDRSADFYMRVCGMKELMKLKLPYMDEVIVGYSGRQAALALMHWTDGSDRTYQDLPVKVVVYVPDPTALAAAIRAEGLEIIREPEAVPELGNAVVGLAKDPDGYIVEILQAEPRE